MVQNSRFWSKNDRKHLILVQNHPKMGKNGPKTVILTPKKSGVFHQILGKNHFCWKVGFWAGNGMFFFIWADSTGAHSFARQGWARGTHDFPHENTLFGPKSGFERRKGPQFFPTYLFLGKVSRKGGLKWVEKPIQSRRGARPGTHVVKRPWFHSFWHCAGVHMRLRIMRARVHHARILVNLAYWVDSTEGHTAPAHFLVPHHSV